MSSTFTEQNRSECISILNQVLDLVVAEYELCRICRFGNSTTNLLIKTPCECAGSVGFIHIICYKTWNKIRKNNLCEICKTDLVIEFENRSTWCIFKIRFMRFFTRKYGWFFLKYTISISCTIPIIYNNVKDVMSIADSLNLMDMNSYEIISFSSILILTDIILAINFLWSMKNYMKLCRILGCWWCDIDDDSYIFDGYIETSSDEE